MFKLCSLFFSHGHCWEVGTPHIRFHKPERSSLLFNDKYAPPNKTIRVRAEQYFLLGCIRVGGGFSTVLVQIEPFPGCGEAWYG